MKNCDTCWDGNCREQRGWHSCNREATQLANSEEAYPMIPNDLINHIFGYVGGAPGCPKCHHPFDTDVSLHTSTSTSGNPSQQQASCSASGCTDLQTAHRLPVKCFQCEHLTCFQCLWRSYLQAMMMREGGFPGSTWIRCDGCAHARGYSVAAIRIDVDSTLDFRRHHEVTLRVMRRLGSAGQRFPVSIKQDRES